MEPVPFTIDVPQADLDDLRHRLAHTRHTPRVTTDWQRGVATHPLDELLAHWEGPYDWRAAESRLNRHRQVRVEAGGLGLHVVRAGRPGATPLLLLHGWPDGVVRFERAIPLLAGRFDLIVPSLPGFGFSDRPAEITGPARVGELLAGLMTALGFEHFAVHGGDIGSTIAEQLTLAHPGRVTALHLGDLPLHRARGLAEADRTDEDRRLFDRLTAWDAQNGGSAYSRLQRSKPQTLAVALDDSPAGLAAWILEKFHGWTDPDGDVFEHFTLDELCTNLTIYWVTRTGGSSAHYYYDNAHSELATARVDAPTAFAQFPNDIVPAARSTAERWFEVVRFTEFPRGGHFGPWEEPELWAADLIAFADRVGI